MYARVLALSHTDLFDNGSLILLIIPLLSDGVLISLEVIYYPVARCVMWDLGSY